MTLSRRELIQGGLLAAVANLPPAHASLESMPAHMWIIDARLDGAPQLLADTQDSSADVHAYRGDPGCIWMNALVPRLAVSPVALHGYTTAPALFCLHYLARGYGLRLSRVLHGAGVPMRIERGDNTPIDLRDPQFSDHESAYAWQMLPTRI